VGVEALGSWHSHEYVHRWAGEDILADMLDLPRRVSAALTADTGIDVRHVVDLGAGPGGYLAQFLRAFPDARGSWVDSSEPMRELARVELAPIGDRVQYVLGDVERLSEAGLGRADVVVSSRVLHHFSPRALERTYRDVFDILGPGGLFFNLDHIGVPENWEPRYRRVREALMGVRKQRLEPHRHDFALSPLGRHLGWLAAAGFEDADVPWRALYTALVVARRPA
jgi:SAM-dependent methyltransferase